MHLLAQPVNLYKDYPYPLALLNSRLKLHTTVLVLSLAPSITVFCMSSTERGYGKKLVDFLLLFIQRVFDLRLGSYKIPAPELSFSDVIYKFVSKRDKRRDR